MQVIMKVHSCLHGRAPAYIYALRTNLRNSVLLIMATEVAAKRVVILRVLVMIA